MLAEHDPLTATFDEIARAANVSRPLVHAYLGDRRGLVDAVHERIVARLERWVGHGLDRAGDPTARLHALVEGTFAFVAAEPGAWRVLAATGGLDQGELHRVRARWAEGLSAGGAAADLAAQAVVAGLVLGVGAWVAAGVEPAAVLAPLAAALGLEA
ncbi:MAG: hypothetical protein JWM05_567 [Acidimicrobiales bacterium]|nr:hypothetical protein [Acidimicrobiales bacterium]